MAGTVVSQKTTTAPLDVTVVPPDSITNLSDGMEEATDSELVLLDPPKVQRYVSPDGAAEAEVDRKVPPDSTSGPPEWTEKPSCETVASVYIVPHYITWY